MSDLLNKVKYPKECFGKIFVLNKNFKDYFKGWILIEGNLHQFLRIYKKRSIMNGNLRNHL